MVKQAQRGIGRALLLALAAVPATTAAATESSIDAVTVYPGGLARVERVAEVELGRGAGELDFAGLPAAVQPDSVRVEVASGATRIGAVEVAREAVGEAPREREQALRQRIEALERERQAALDRVAAARSQIRFIEGLAELPQGEGAAEALTAGEGAERWSALWERIGEGSRAAYERRREGEHEAATLEQRIDALRRELEQLGGDRRETVRVTIPYRTDAAGPAEIVLSYRVRGPRWEPLYATRLDTAAGRLTLQRGARVQQATGEDWRDVRLALSTSRPVDGDLPEPGAWWIDLAPEAGAQRELADQAMALEAPEQEADATRRARTVNAEFAATYAIPGRISVPAGNQPREVEIGTETLAAEIGARVFPQRDTAAWLTATATWEGAGPLPAGRLTRFRDGAYVGAGRLSVWPPGQARDLAFGMDPHVDVRFEPTRDEAGESGFITTRSTLVRRYQLAVTNRHGRALPVTALFRVPVPRNEAIEVETLFSRPPTESDIDDRQGVHAWRLDLAAGDEATLELGYDIAYPEDRELRGH